MSVTPFQFLESARSLAVAVDEMSKRNSISRAYYAAYHLAKNIFPPVREEDAKVGLHKQYIDQLLANEAGTCQRNIGVKLSTMHARRIRADYRLDENLRVSEAAQQIANAIELFTLLEKDKEAV